MFSVRGYGVNIAVRVSVGVALSALLLGSTLTGSVGVATVTTADVHLRSEVAAKKKAAKGFLKIVVTGRGTYTVIGKGFRKSGQTSKTLRVKPGAYTIKVSSGSAKPGNVRVRKGKVSRVTVVFVAPTPSTSPTPAPSPAVSSVPSPPVTPPTTPTPTPTQTSGGAPGLVELVSTNEEGVQANLRSYAPAWSPDGTKIAFTSVATNLVTGDTNWVADVFVKSLVTGAIQLVSSDGAGKPGEYASSEPAWSPDGTKIAFHSNSPLAPGDTKPTLGGIFVKTLATGVVQRINTSASGDKPNLPSYNTDTVGWKLAWSPDSTRVAFTSNATNLVPGDTNNAPDLFVKTLSTGEILRVNTDPGGNQAEYGITAPPQGVRPGLNPQWSPDGTKIAFEDSRGLNLVPGVEAGVYVKTLSSGAIDVVRDAAGEPVGAREPAWSPDGSKIAFVSGESHLVSGDGNEQADVFVKDLATGAITCASTNPDGSVAEGGRAPRWSADGTRISFIGWDSFALDDAIGGYEVFVKTLGNGTLQRASTDAAGNKAPALLDIYDAAPWSPAANKLAFLSPATNLAPGATNGETHVFVKTLG